MNPKATPFKPSKETHEVLKARHNALKSAVSAPFAPIQMLTIGQKKQMQIKSDIFEKHLTWPDLQTLMTAVSMAEFVLE